MAVQFEIESVIKVSGRGYFVLARQVSPGQNFVVTDESFLGDVELSKYLDVPRATNDKGGQRHNLFAFRLKNDEDNSTLKPMTVVDLVPGDTLHYLKPWYPDNTDLVTQLNREINKDHLLYGKPVKTLARRQDNDDVLFEVGDTDFKYAAVHLTWAQKTSGDPKYPRTETYKNWQELYETRIVIDHQDWENE